MPRARAVSALALALGLHALAAALLPWRETPPQFAPRRLAASTFNLDLDLETFAVKASTSTSAAAKASAGSAKASKGTSTSTSESTSTSKSKSNSTATKETDGTWFFPTTRVDLALGERTGALARANGVGPTDVRPGAGSPLLLSLDSIDAANGRARTGPLREAVDEVARRAEAPMEGVAVFEITVGPKTAPRARLLEASSEYGGWSGLTEALDAIAAKKTLRFPTNGQGLRVVVRVEAAMRLVDGRREKDLGVKTSTTPLGIRDDVAPGDSKLVLPSATLHLRGKVCSLSLTAGLTPFPIGGGCSLEAIGSRASRRVTSTLVSEERTDVTAER